MILAGLALGCTTYPNYEHERVRVSQTELATEPWFQDWNDPPLPSPGNIDDWECLRACSAHADPTLFRIGGITGCRNEWARGGEAAGIIKFSCTGLKAHGRDRGATSTWTDTRRAGPAR